MMMETESPACAAKLYRRPKLPRRCGAAQVAVVSESLTGTPGVTLCSRHGCTTNSTGRRAGLFFAFSADTTTVSWYPPVGSPTGLKASRSVAGAVPLVGLTNPSHGSPIASRALQDRVPGPVFTTARLSWFTRRLPTAAESLTWSGARERVATGGGVLVSLSTWQVASSIRRGARATDRRTPRLGVRALRSPRIFQVGPTTSP